MPESLYSNGMCEIILCDNQGKFLEDRYVNQKKPEPESGKTSVVTESSAANSESFANGMVREKEKNATVNYGWEMIKTCRREDIVAKRKVYTPTNQAQVVICSQEEGNQTAPIELGDSEGEQDL